MHCPCHSKKDYQDCCEPFITGTARPQTPEQLMRSRYTAYTQANTDYIADTMRGKAAENFDKQSAKTWAAKVTWQDLEVCNAPTPSAKQGTVEFIARYQENGKTAQIHEVSTFERIGSRWYYVDGKQPSISRNALCPCGSGKKFKRCCRSPTAYTHLI